MSGKSLTPDQITEAVTLRAAGYTVTGIAQRLGTSVRTLTRLFERYGAKKGSVRDELIAAAKKDLIEGITTNRVREEAARLIADDLAHARLLRQRIAEAADYLTASNLEEAALLMRAAAAYSTAIKNTSDMLRHSLRTESALDAQDPADLPVLVVQELTAEEATKMRQELSGDDGASGEVAAPALAVEPVNHDNERVDEGED